MTGAEGGREREFWAPISIGIGALFATMAAIRFADLAVIPMSGIAAVGLGATLVALSVIDIRTQRLPDALTFPLGAVGLGLAAASGYDSLASHGAAAFAGYLFFRLLAAGYRALRGIDGLGGGDAKLLGAGGAWVGIDALATVVLVSSLSALTLLVVLMGAGRRVARGRRIPFGPFLALGIWYAWLFGPLLGT